SGRDPRVYARAPVERAVIRLDGDGFHVGVAQVADDVVRGPGGAPGRGGPVTGTESLEDRGEPPQLPGEHVEQVPRIELAGALGPQQQGHAFPSRMAANGKGR